MPIDNRFKWLGPKGIPQDILDLRKSSLDYHLNLGTPVYHKHKWNLRDLREGKVMRCPLNHDETYGQGRQWDPYCFGTGLLGGFADAVLVFVTLGDTVQDVIQANEQGVLMMQRHPQLSAPWYPEMGDGDIIVTGEFDEEMKFVKEKDRYVLSEVTPTTMRGFPKGARRAIEYKVSQTGQVDLLPYGHQYYNVPLDFDEGNIPPEEFPTDPDQIPPVDVVIGQGFSSFRVGIALAGRYPFESSTERGINVEGLGTSSSHTQGLKLTGKDKGTTVYL